MTRCTFLFTLFMTSSGLAGPAGAAVSLPRRPYVQNVSPTGLSLLWETPRIESGTVKLRSLASADAWEPSSGPARHHEVRFEGLVPSSSYEYAVQTSSAGSSPCPRTARSPRWCTRSPGATAASS